MSCFGGGGGGKPRSRDLLSQANLERRDLNAANQQLQRKVAQLTDALQTQRDDLSEAQQNHSKLRLFLEKEVDCKNKALLDCLKALKASNINNEAPEESTEAAIKAYKAQEDELTSSLRKAQTELEHVRESNKKLVQEEAAAQDQKASALSKAKRQIEAAELRSKALESNNAGLSDLNKELHERLERMEKEKRDAKEHGVAGESKLRELLRELDEAHEQADKALKEQQSLRDELAETTQNLEHHKRNLAAVEQKLSSTQAEAQVNHERAESLQAEYKPFKSRALAAEAELRNTSVELDQTKEALDTALSGLRDAKDELVYMRPRMEEVDTKLQATQAELHDTKEKLAALTTKSITQGVEIETLTRRLNDHKDRKEQLHLQLAQAKQELSHAEAQLRETNEKYVAAKQDLVATNEKLAVVLQEHHVMLEDMSGSGDTLLITTRELQECKKHLEEARQGIDGLRAQRREAQSKLSQANAELQILGTYCSSAGRDSACKRSLLAGVVRLATSFASPERDLDGSLESYYHAAVSESCMHVKLCDLSLGLIGPLVKGIKDTKSLEQLVVELDASREVVPEKAGLRIACLAAALSLNNSLQSVELLGSSWEEQGTGMAGPFLGLGCPPPTASMDAPMSNLSCVQVDTRLFSPQCASALTDLLIKGHVELKRPSGAGVLRLYTEHCNLDEWYGECIQHAVNPGVAAQGRTLTQAAMLQHTKSNGSESLRGLEDGAGGSRNGAVQVPDVIVQLPCPPTDVLEQTPLSSDLSQEGLESHHMVLVLAVLLTCPHLKSLRMDGNKIADSGFETLAQGLQHNSTLHTLSVCRNMMKQPGARALGQALKQNTGLKKLDVSGQRFEGLGPTGTEALVNPLRHNKTLLELGIASNALGTQGAAALAAMLSHNTTLQRIAVVSTNGMDESAIRGALQKSAKRTDLIVT